MGGGAEEGGTGGKETEKGRWVKSNRTERFQASAGAEGIAGPFLAVLLIKASQAVCSFESLTSTDPRVRPSVYPPSHISEEACYDLQKLT